MSPKPFQHPKGGFSASSQEQLSQAIRNETVAKLICQLIPASCPFSRDIKLLGYCFHIPPMCQLNPFYNQLMSLRFQALTYLAKTEQDQNKL
jgi:hypothetical protein